MFCRLPVLGLSVLGPKGQVVLALVPLDIEVHGLFELAVVHPYQVTSGVSYDGTTCRSLHERASGCEEEVPVIAPGIPLCDLWCRCFKINGMETLAGVYAMKAQVIGVERERGGPGYGNGGEKQQRLHDGRRQTIGLE